VTLVNILIHNECHIHEWVYEWVSHHESHVTHVNTHIHECHIHEWVVSHVNESYHIHSVISHTWMRHITYDSLGEWVILRIWMSHITYECFVTHMNESYHIWVLRYTHEWVISHMSALSHTWMSHITYECFVSRIWIDRANKSCHACTWARSKTCMIYVTHIRMTHYVNEPCCAY